MNFSHGRLYDTVMVRGSKNFTGVLSVILTLFTPHKSVTLTLSGPMRSETDMEVASSGRITSKYSTSWFVLLLSAYSSDTLRPPKEPMESSLVSSRQ